MSGSSRDVWRKKTPRNSLIRAHLSRLHVNLGVPDDPRAPESAEGADRPWTGSVTK